MKTTYLILSEAIGSYKDKYFPNGNPTLVDDELTVSDFIAAASANTAASPRDTVKAVRVASRFGNVFDPDGTPQEGLDILQRAKRAAR